MGPDKNKGEYHATISMFFGIIVMMHYEKGARHHMPHLHAKYAEHAVVMDFEGSVLSGSIPPRQMTLLKAWIVLHREELDADWSILMNEGDVFRIDPLR